MSTTAAAAATAKRTTVTVTFHARLMTTPVSPAPRGSSAFDPVEPWSTPGNLCPDERRLGFRLTLVN